MANKPKKMTWKEIIEKYPDEWVLLDDYEPDIDFDGTGIIATKGRVLVHAKDKREFYKKSKELVEKIPPGWNHSQRYTGDPATPYQKWLWEQANS